MMFLRVLPSLTVLVGIGIGEVSQSPSRDVLLPLLPSLALAAFAPLASCLALGLFASGCDLMLVSTAGMSTGVGRDPAPGRAGSGSRSAIFD